MRLPRPTSSSRVNSVRREAAHLGLALRVFPSCFMPDLDPRSVSLMECLGPECVSMLLEWMKTRSAELDVTTSIERAPEMPRQALLFKTVAYQEDAPAVRSP